MKKIMVALAAIAVAMGAHAAAVDWNLTAASNKGWDVYAFANTTTESLVAICTSTDSAVWANLGTKVGSTSSSRGTLTGSTAGFATGVPATLTFVLVNGNIADGADYIVGTTLNVAGNVYEPPATPTTFKTTLVSAATGTFSTGSVPEPTSGLLLLLGMAGLALKRKVA